LDSTYFSLTDLSLSAGVSHSFIFSDVISKNDAVTFVPQLSLIGGRQSFQSSSNMRLPGVPEREVNDDRIRKIYKLTSSSSSSSHLSLQTLAFSTSLTYIKKAVSLSTSYFGGYYFNSTSGNKLSHIFNISVGLTF
jgi:hypothetical protein